MKYSETLVWKAVYEFAPAFQIARENAISINLPQAVNVASLRAFMLCGNSGISSLGMDKSYAAYILQDVLKELNEVGWMTFGAQEEFWGK